MNFALSAGRPQQLEVSHLRVSRLSGSRRSYTGGFLGSVTVKEYSNAKLGVRIGAGGIDTDGFCFIDLEDKEAGTHCNFRRLLSQRNPEFEHPLAAESMDAAKAHLQAYAAALRDHAVDVLLGDFSVFHR